MLWFCLFYKTSSRRIDREEKSFLDRLLIDVISEVFLCFYGFNTTFSFQSMGVCFIGERNFENFLLEVSNIESVTIFMFCSGFQ